MFFAFGLLVLTGVARPTDGAVTLREQQEIALRAINYYRGLAGLPKAQLDTKLCASAQLHAQYINNHWEGTNPHEEKPGASGYVGKDPFDRIKAAGVKATTTNECISFGERLSCEAVDDLMRVPYHRTAFIDSAVLRVGIGYTKHVPDTVWVLDFTSDEERFVVWPPVEAHDVPPQTTLFESPDPLRIHGVSRQTVGFVVTACLGESNLKFVRANITDKAGATIQAFVNHPQNDDMSPSSVILIPEKPLKSYTTYSAHLEMKRPNGEAVVKDWSFHTNNLEYNFEYTNRCSWFPEKPTGGATIEGTVASVSTDGSSITVSGIKNAASPKAFKVTSASHLRSYDDPLGLDVERVTVVTGARVVFTTTKDAPNTVRDLMVLNSAG